MRLFISYAHKDIRKVKQLIKLLEAGGHDVWYDTGLLPGQDWQQELLDQIKACGVLVSMISPDSLASEWCQWELARAAELEKPVVPILLKETKDVPKALSSIQYINVTKGITAEAVARLMGGLNTVVSSLIMVVPRPQDLPPAPANPAGSPMPPKTYPVWLLSSAVALSIIALGFLTLLALPDDTRSSLLQSLSLISGESEALSPMEAFEFPPSLQIPGEPLLMRDVAASGGTVAFAGDLGLYIYRPAEGAPFRVKGLDCALSAVAVTPDGQTVWFGLSDTATLVTLTEVCEERVGVYSLEDDTVELLNPVDAEGAPVLIDELLSVEAGPDGSVWFGDKFKGLIERAPDGEWYTLPTFFEVGYDRAEHIAVGPAGDVVWVSDGLRLYRYRNAAWNTFDTQDIRPGDLIRDLTVDYAGRLWIAHDQGVSVVTQAEDGRLIPVVCGAPDLPAGEVLALAATQNWHEVWLAMASGYARAVVPSDLVTSCADLRIDQRHEADEIKGFLDAANLITMAIDESSESDLAIWFLHRGTEDVYVITEQGAVVE